MEIDVKPIQVQESPSVIILVKLQTRLSADINKYFEEFDVRPSELVTIIKDTLDMRFGSCDWYKSIMREET